MVITGDLGCGFFVDFTKTTQTKICWRKSILTNSTLNTCSQFDFVFVTPQQQTQQQACWLLQRENQDQKSLDTTNQGEREKRNVSSTLMSLISIKRHSTQNCFCCVDRWNHTKHFLRKKTCQQLFFCFSKFLPA